MCIVYTWIWFRMCVSVVSSGCTCIVVGVHSLGTMCTGFQNVLKGTTQQWPRISWCHTNHIKMAVAVGGQGLEAAISNWKFQLKMCSESPCKAMSFLVLLSPNSSCFYVYSHIGLSSFSCSDKLRIVERPRCGPFNVSQKNVFVYEVAVLEKKPEICFLFCCLLLVSHHLRLKCCSFTPLQEQLHLWKTN